LSSYRFCRTDDIGLLVDALNRCWAPSFPGEPPMDAASFKRSIRDLQVWCSSCMVAFAGADPVGVLIGAKRPSATLVHRIAVHPDHQRQGHGRHLLASLGSKLAILGPPRIVAEVPESLAPACGLFEACGYAEEARLTDYALQCGENDAGRTEPPGPDNAGRFVIPLTVDDLAANGLLEGDSEVCWERSIETLIARKDDISGIAVASDERIEAYLLYLEIWKFGNREVSHAPATASASRPATAAGATPDFQILSLRTFIEDGGARLKQLLARLGRGTFRIPKVHPAEVSQELLETLGFRAGARYVLYAGRARSE
jgi:GNAT superfamily N-acetyltransferase